MGSNRAENVRSSSTEAGNGTRAWLRLRPLRHCSKLFEAEEKNGSYEILEVKNETSREKFESCEDYKKSVSFETVR